MPASRCDGSVSAVDVAVIGAGPAGLASAVAAAAAGCRIGLVDAGTRPGGQFWRHREGGPDVTGHGFATFRRLWAQVESLRATGRVAYLPRHHAWHLEQQARGFMVHLVDEGTRAQARIELLAQVIVLAPGAHDRQLPFPGWTLPGVFTAGATQALLKGHGVVAGRRVIVAGSGPFLLPVAAGLAESGARVVGVLESGRPTAFVRHPVTMFRNRDKLAEGAGYLWTLARHRVPYRTRMALTAALGEDAVTAVRVARLDTGWRVRPGSERVIECDTVAVAYGFTPQVGLPLALGCETRVDTDGSLVVTVDVEQRSSVPGVYVAGEACGVGGAQLALAEGELAGLHAAREAIGTMPDPTVIARLTRKRAGGRAFAAAMHEAYRIEPGWQGWLDPSTIICRCEEVDLDRLRRAVKDLGATDARSAKLLARVGMGRCQGRVCGSAVATLVAESCGRPVRDVDLNAMASRPIAQPIALGALARDAGPHRTMRPAPTVAAAEDGLSTYQGIP